MFCYLPGHCTLRITMDDFHNRSTLVWTVHITRCVKGIYMYVCWGGGVLESGFAGYLLLASQNPHSIIVYSVASHRPHLKSLLGKCHYDFKNGIQCESTVKYQNKGRNHFSATNLPSFKSLLTRIFLSQKS